MFENIPLNKFSLKKTLQSAQDQLKNPFKTIRNDGANSITANH
jgi:hypothetical protein